MGLADDLVQKAVTEAFEEVDESALLDAAFERRLRGRELPDLDDKARPAWFADWSARASRSAPCCGRSGSSPASD